MIQFTSIPAGRFLMGSDAGHDDERPVHEVEVDAFDCAVYPVTESQYATFLDATGHERLTASGLGPPELRAKRAVSGGGLRLTEELPVTSVSWVDAQAFCKWRTDLGDPMRLPTEAEWEWAARGGLTGARYPWGDTIPDWIPQQGKGPLSGPWPVTLGEPNGFGLFGIGANIHEWCADWYAGDYYARSPARNPTGPETGRRRASRGGAWRHDITVSRCSQRSRIDPTFRYTDYSFRVVRPPSLP